MDTRPDPVEILAHVPERDGRQRAFDVWVHKATKAGWAVTVESTCTDQPGTALCGVVDIEGLRYRVFFAKRVRVEVAMVPPGKHLIAAAVDLTMGRAEGVTWTSEFRHAAWAEPIIDDEPA